MTLVDFAEVDARALAVRERLGLGIAPIGDAPAILRDAGLVVLVRPLGSGPEGLYIRREDYGAVLLNGDAYLPRLRFTAAHELGHHEYGARSAVDQVTGATTEDPEEKRANAFAASFLLPREALAQRVGAAEPISATRVGELANEFGVSYPVAVYRLHNVGLLRGGAAHRDDLLQSSSAVLTYELRQRRLERRTVLPSDYVQLAIDAYSRADVSLERLAELLFDDEVTVREALQSARLLRPEDA